ncbi:hypothetical protein KUTeg_000615 [Tegillarca granosa]|uniref:EF-hand domain-containing protein n=1 Tax=Tegillarca granosa TaxID=220873 RepID=A0ABQ9FY42_TEGGR|nr:hypothetical protein KUTeg_000615 [Tegillarca granosa]
MDQTKADKKGTSIPKDLEAQVRTLFTVFDKNGDDNISTKELGKAMRFLGMCPTEKQVKAAMKALDTDRNGRVSFKEFLEFMKKAIEEDPECLNQEPSLKSAFKVFDRDGNGFIDAKELRFAMKQLGETLSDKELEEMMKEADVDGDGKINYEEFVRVWTESNQ